MRRPVGRNQSQCGRCADSDKHFQEMAEDGARGVVCGAPTGERLSGVWLCAGSWEMFFGIGASTPMYRLRRRDHAKAQSSGLRRQEGIIESAWIQRRMRPGVGDNAHL
jgi:hypothetical protein